MSIRSALSHHDMAMPGERHRHLPSRVRRNVCPEGRHRFLALRRQNSLYVNGMDPGDAIRTPQINQHASPVATVKAVRDHVTEWLRDMTRFGNLIVEGRDITTAVFPESPARFYLVASPEARAERRRTEEVEKGIADQSIEEVKKSLLARDAIDSSRQHAPLRKADGALEIDSTFMSLEEVVQTVINALPAEWRNGV